MTTQSLNISIPFIAVSLCLFLCQCHGFEVIPTLNETTVVSCAHTGQKQSVVWDVRLIGISKDGTERLLCREGMDHCKDMFMFKENSNKFLFFWQPISAKDMDLAYTCEFTVSRTYDDPHETKKGKQTTIHMGSKKLETTCPPSPSCFSDGSSNLYPLNWILISLVILTLLYSCVITVLYFRQKNDQNTENEKGIYVEMRKVPMTPNLIYDTSAIEL